MSAAPDGVMDDVTAPTGPAEPVEPDEIAEPAREDRFIGGLTEAIGGGLGEHAVRRRNKLMTPVRIVLVLAMMTLGLHYLQKYPCQDATWHDWSQYRYFCYTD